MRIVRVSKSVCAKASGSMNDLRSYKYRVWILCLDCAVRARDASAQIAAFIMVLALLYKKQHFSMVGTRFTQFTVKSSNKSNSQNDKMSALPEITCYTFFVGYDVWIDEHFCVVPKINEKVRLPWPFHDCDSFAEIHCSKMSKYRGGVIEDTNSKSWFFIGFYTIYFAVATESLDQPLVLVLWNP